MDVGHADFDILAELELAAILGDFERADLARPLIDILEQVLVDGFRVGEVEIAARRAFALALQVEVGFGAFQDFGAVMPSRFRNMLVPGMR